MRCCGRPTIESLLWQFTYALLEHLRFDVFVALFGLPVSAVTAMHVYVVYKDHTAGGVPVGGWMMLQA
jgi:hypothetical protein